MAKGYIIKNIKSGYFFTRNNSFAELSHITYIYKDYASAYKDLDRAKNCQMWNLAEEMCGTDRWHIDNIDADFLDNIKENIDLRIRGCYLEEGSVS